MPRQRTNYKADQNQDSTQDTVPKNNSNFKFERLSNGIQQYNNTTPTEEEVINFVLPVETFLKLWQMNFLQRLVSSTITPLCYL